jgi:RNA polymerase-binding transcription factor DksA
MGRLEQEQKMTSIAERKTQLENRLKELDHRLHDIDHELEGHHNRDVEDHATEIEGDEVLEGIGNAGVMEIKMINAALQRIADEIYGECVRCGEDISDARLDVLPYTPICKTCAAKAES